MERKYAPQRNKKYGRPTASQLKGFTVDELINAYNACPSLKEIACQFGISTVTARKYINGSGMKIYPGPKAPLSKERKHCSAVAIWLRNHPLTVLPPTISQVARLMNLPRRTVYQYLKRREKKAIRWRKALCDFIYAGEGFLPGDNGIEIKTASIQTFSIFGERYNCHARILARLFSGIIIDIKIDNTFNLGKQVLTKLK